MVWSCFINKYMIKKTKQIMWIDWDTMLKITCQADGLDDSMKNDLFEDMSTVSEAFLDPDDFSYHFHLHF